MRGVPIGPWMVLGAAVLSACNPGANLDAAKAERAKPVQRFDNFLAAASDGKQRVAAAGGSVVVTSPDAGKTWVREPLAAPAAIVGMSACPDGSFAALDFYRKVWTGDAQARDWAARPLDADFNPVAISCDAQNRLWVVGSYSTVLMSADKGASWQAQPPGEDAILTTIHFVDGEHGFIGGEFGTLLVTADGGASWTRQPGLPEDFYPYAMVFTDTQTGWVSGLGGAILHTQDGGKTWNPQTNASGAQMFALLGVDGTLYGVGAGGVMLKLAGDSWVAVENAPRFPSYLTAATALESRNLLVAGAAGTLKTVSLAAPAASPPADPVAPNKEVQP